MNVRASRPSEPKHADGDTKRTDKGRWEAFFGLEFALGVELGFDVAVEVVEEGGYDEDGADEDAGEGETFFAETEVVGSYEDDGEGFEPDVEEAVD